MRAVLALPLLLLAAPLSGCLEEPRSGTPAPGVGDPSQVPLPSPTASTLPSLPVTTPTPATPSPPTTPPTPASPSPPTPEPPRSDEWRRAQGTVYHELHDFGVPPAGWNRTDALFVRHETTLLYVNVTWQGEAPGPDDPPAIRVLGPDGSARVVCVAPAPCVRVFEPPETGQWELYYAGRGNATSRAVLHAEMREPEVLQSHAVFSKTHDFWSGAETDRTMGVVFTAGKTQGSFLVAFTDPADPAAGPPADPGNVRVTIRSPAGNETTFAAADGAIFGLDFQDPPAGLWSVSFLGAGDVRATVQAKGAG